MNGNMRKHRQRRKPQNGLKSFCRLLFTLGYFSGMLPRKDVMVFSVSPHIFARETPRKPPDVSVPGPPWLTSAAMETGNRSWWDREPHSGGAIKQLVGPRFHYFTLLHNLENLCPRVAYLTQYLLTGITQNITYVGERYTVIWMLLSALLVKDPWWRTWNTWQGCFL